MEKHYVYSARTTEKGLALLNKTKGDKSWDTFINEAVAAHYDLPLDVIALPPSEFIANRAATKAKKEADKAAAKVAKAAKTAKDKADKAAKAKADKAKADKAKADKAAKDKAAKAKADKEAADKAAAAAKDSALTNPKPAKKNGKKTTPAAEPAAEATDN